MFLEPKVLKMLKKTNEKTTHTDFILLSLFYAHIWMVVTFFVVNFLGVLVITRHHEVGFLRC